MKSFLKAHSFIGLAMTVLLIVGIHCTLTDEFQSSKDYSKFLNSSYILVHTLSGNILLVDRQTGLLKWSMLLEPALSISYNGGPMLIADPLDGRLYEYSTSASDVLTHLDHSVMGYVRRSPAYYRNYLSFGSKADSWMLIDLRTGKVFQTSTLTHAQQCPMQFTPSTSASSESVPMFTMDNSVGLGQTQYNLLFRDPVTGSAKLNITYNTFASHTEPDLQIIDLQHVATTEPRLLTFKGKKLVWELPLSSHVVGLYAVWNSNIRQPLEGCNVSSRLFLNPSLWDGASSKKNTESYQHVMLDDSDPSFDSLLVPSDNCGETLSPSRMLPHILKRIAFTTYALDFGDKGPLVSNDIKRSFFETKFNQTLDLVLSLLVGQSSAAPLYAIPCVAETSLQLRSIRRAPEELLLEGPQSEPNLPPQPDSDLNHWALGLVGLYELPWSQLSRWATNNHVPMWARVSRWRQITDEFNRWALIISEKINDSALPGNEFNLLDNPPGDVVPRIFSRLPLQALFIMLLISALFFSTCLNRLVQKIRRNHQKMGSSFQTTAATGCTGDHDLGFLPVHFDMPDQDGWAGCSAEEAGQPEAIRFKLNDVIGHGANGTMVFAGTFGQHKTAVKRIVRQHQLEKHWRREHAILLHLQHPNLVRCFWTGSTANFHYLVMQRCTTSLADLLQTDSTDPFSRWHLTPVQIIHQFTLAVVCLHHNRIVHRDLKPSNVLIVSNGTESRTVVGDFGLSRPLSTDRHELTNSFRPQLMVSIAAGTRLKNTGTAIDPNVLGCSVAYKDHIDKNVFSLDSLNGDQTSLGVTYGTLGWMAPELYDTSTDCVTYAIDIFSCGLLAYHVLTVGGHPFDDLDQQSGLKDESATLSDANLNKSTASSRSSNSDGLQPCSSARLSRHHARQMAIVEGRPPTFGPQFFTSLDVPTATVGRHLIQTMLSVDPAKRPTAEEVTSHPLFWTPGKMIRFISEISDLLDTREDELPDAGFNGSWLPASDVNEDNAAFFVKKCRFIPQRRALLDDIEKSSHLVFNDHWFHQLEPGVVQDLMSTRGYQDTSLLDLLRAIRNKRNHFWHLKDHIRALLGHTQDGMAFYWTSRFPFLVPLLYDLSRRHLTCMSSMEEYLPNVVSRTSSAKSEGEVGVVQECQSTRCWIESNQSKMFSHSPRRNARQPWKRGDVVSVQAQDSQPLRAPALDTTIRDEQNVGSASVQPPSDTEASSEFVGTKPRRRRPHQPKKMRPAKRKVDRCTLLATAGSELL